MKAWRDQERDRTAPQPELLLTAAEAFPRLEQIVLGAQDRVAASFRVFDPTTTLRSDAGRAIGKTWSDLIAHTLGRGVRMEIIVSDFDPVARYAMHHQAHLSVARMKEAAARSGRADLLTVRTAMHGARVGWLHRLALAPMVNRYLKDIARMLNDLNADERDAHFDLSSALPKLVRRDAQGRARPKPAHKHAVHPVTHHQKLLVADGHVLYVGGLDLNDRRYDGPDHRQIGSQTWHDVQIVLHGEVAGDAERHIQSFEAETSGIARPSPKSRLLRTVSAKRAPWAQRLGPKPLINELQERHLAEIARAERLIYLESQFLRDRHVAAALAERARQVSDLRLIAILPAAPEEVAFENSTSLDSRFGEAMQAYCVDKVARAFGDRAVFCAPAMPKVAPPDGTRGTHHAAPIVYVHAKVSIFDDACAIVSSANLNGRSFRWDTEAGITVTEPEEVREIRHRLMAHWLPDDPHPSLFGFDTAAQGWRRLANANAEAPPLERKGFLLPFPLESARRFGVPLPFLPQEMV